ncbi:IS3 family transposase [Pseudoalteromonas sp. DL2-H2.2]|uniref:IS3 family transposase n=1 Tax=Pseudoalteromonas sp. DL2-H2.2 TaxID=2908889 RepID=UPI001F2DDD2F|nr:IS3 family transposase [Pseudoalteromonas sp. DL2-H2.2]MCF2911257.1 IS3 family transposase [Pseudoalteromonas sp. DL2-H2.2]
MTKQKRQYKTYPKEFKEEAVALVSEQGYTVAQAAEAVGVSTSLLYKWKEHIEQEQAGNKLVNSERDELLALRKEVKQLRMEKDIFKKGQCLLCERNEVKYQFIQVQSDEYPTLILCRVMGVSSSAYYDWCKRPAQVIDAQTLRLFRRIKVLFKESRQSLGSRQMMKQLRKEGFKIGRFKVRRLMKKLGLVVRQRQAYKVTTNSKHSNQVADNVLARQFNPTAPNVAWAGDVTYLRTAQGWMYLAIVMDLHSRRIIGWALSKRMTVQLVERALQMAINLRQPPKGVIFHSDRGSQYTSKCYQALLTKHGFIASMSGKEACLDNAVVERFFGSLKNEWLLNVRHLTRDSIRSDVEKYIRYYNKIRLHSSLDDMSPIEYENYKKKVSGWT